MTDYYPAAVAVAAATAAKELEHGGGNLWLVEVIVLDIAMSFVRPRRSIQILALAPALSQRDVLQANDVAHGRRGSLRCGNLALPLAALLVTALAPPLAAVVHSLVLPLSSSVLLATAFAPALAQHEQIPNGLPRGPPVVFHGAFALPIKTAISPPEILAVRDERSCVRTFGARGRPEQIILCRALVVDVVDHGGHGA